MYVVTRAKEKETKRPTQRIDQCSDFSIAYRLFMYTILLCIKMAWIKRINFFMTRQKKVQNPLYHPELSFHQRVNLKL